VKTLFEKFYVPFLFYPVTMLIVLGIAACLTIIGVMSFSKIKLGLTQNVSLVENFDTFKFFNTFNEYGEAGPPAYLVFKNIDYTIESNLEVMAEMQVQLAQLKDTVIAPVYSWVTPFKNFINPTGAWNVPCGSSKAAVLDFN